MYVCIYVLCVFTCVGMCVYATMHTSIQLTIINNNITYVHVCSVRTYSALFVCAMCVFVYVYAYTHTRAGMDEWKATAGNCICAGTHMHAGFIYM